MIKLSKYSVGDRVIVYSAGTAVFVSDYDSYKRQNKGQDLILEIIGYRDQPNPYFVLLSDTDRYGGERITNHTVEKWGVDPRHKESYGWPFFLSGFGGLAPKRKCFDCEVFCGTVRFDGEVWRYCEVWR